MAVRGGSHRALVVDRVRAVVVADSPSAAVHTGSRAAVVGGSPEVVADTELKFKIALPQPKTIFKSTNYCKGLDNLVLAVVDTTSSPQSKTREFNNNYSCHTLGKQTTANYF